MNAVREDTIFLFSSNASELYVLDSIETLALPRGTVHHFRYQLQYVHPSLIQKIPLQNSGEANALKNRDIAVCYLYQKETTASNGTTTREWEAIYPIRHCVLEYAYRTGESQLDVAHFYFRVEDYYDYGKEGGEHSPKTMQETVQAAIDYTETTEKYFAVMGRLFQAPIAKQQFDESAFYSSANAVKPEHLLTPDGKKKYFPLFYFFSGIVGWKPNVASRILGLSNGKSTTLKPDFDRASLKSYYKLKEGGKYTFELAYFSPETPPEPESQITLSASPDLFASPTNAELKVASRYDEEYFLIIPKMVEKEVWSALQFQSAIKPPINIPSVPIDIDRTFPILVRPRIIRRTLRGFFDFTGDVAISASAASITLWAASVRVDITSTFSLVAIVLWVSSKTIAKLLGGALGSRA